MSGIDSVGQPDTPPLPVEPLLAPDVPTDPEAGVTAEPPPLDRDAALERNAGAIASRRFAGQLLQGLLQSQLGDADEPVAGVGEGAGAPEPTGGGYTDEQFEAVLTGLIRSMERPENDRYDELLGDHEHAWTLRRILDKGPPYRALSDDQQKLMLKVALNSASRDGLDHLMRKATPEQCAQIAAAIAEEEQLQDKVANEWSPEAKQELFQRATSEARDKLIGSLSSSQRAAFIAGLTKEQRAEALGSLSEKDLNGVFAGTTSEQLAALAEGVAGSPALQKQVAEQLEAKNLDALLGQLVGDKATSGIVQHLTAEAKAGVVERLRASGGDKLVHGFLSGLDEARLEGVLQAVHAQGGEDGAKALAALVRDVSSLGAGDPVARAIVRFLGRTPPGKEGTYLQEILRDPAARGRMEDALSELMDRTPSSGEDQKALREALRDLVEGAGSDPETRERLLGILEHERTEWSSGEEKIKRLKGKWEAISDTEITELQETVDQEVREVNNLIETFRGSTDVDERKRLAKKLQEKVASLEKSVSGGVSAGISVEGFGELKSKIDTLVKMTDELKKGESVEASASKMRKIDQHLKDVTSEVSTVTKTIKRSLQVLDRVKQRKTTDAEAQVASVNETLAHVVRSLKG